MANNTDSLGDRMKEYEKVFNYKLTKRTPVIIRIDGRAFHTFCKNMEKPFDEHFIESMIATAKTVASQMQGFIIGYHQSDEVTFYINNIQSLESDAWFGNELQKLVSITASSFTANFNRIYGSTRATFDTRVFSVPDEEVPNVFVWRQRDWERNSVFMFARAYFSHNELHKKSVRDIHNMLEVIGKNWYKLDPHLKYGTFFLKNDSISYNRKLDYNSLLKLMEISK